MSDDDRALPHDLDAERVLVGSCLISPEALERAVNLVSSFDFYSRRHGLVWSAMRAVRADGHEVDYVSVVGRLRDHNNLEAVGGPAAVVSLFDGLIPSSHVETHAWRVLDRSRRRHLVQAADRLQTAAQNGTSAEDLQGYIRDVSELAGSARIAVPSSVDLWSPTIVAMRPEFTVANFIRRKGLHLGWAPPSGGKTWTLLRIAHELMYGPGRARLLDHPELWINRRRPGPAWQRTLWIATEEDANTLKYKAEWIRRGLDNGGKLHAPGSAGEFLGELRFIWAPQPGRRVTLSDLPAILEHEGPFDAVFLDSLTGLRPRTMNGERIAWDRDNEASNELCLELRGLAETYSTAIFIIHHTGRETERGYRGPTEWWASADVMFGLVPDNGRTQVVTSAPKGKNRDGTRLPDFLLEPSWTAGEPPNPDHGWYNLEYVSAAVSTRLSVHALRVHNICLEAFSKGSTWISQAEIFDAFGGSKTTGRRAIVQCVTAGLLHDTGTTTPGRHGSPLYGRGPGIRSDSTHAAAEASETLPFPIYKEAGVQPTPETADPSIEEKDEDDRIPW